MSNNKCYEEAKLWSRARQRSNERTNSRRHKPDWGELATEMENKEPHNKKKKYLVRSGVVI